MVDCTEFPEVLGLLWVDLLGSEKAFIPVIWIELELAGFDVSDMLLIPKICILLLVD